MKRRETEVTEEAEETTGSWCDRPDRGHSSRSVHVLVAGKVQCNLRTRYYRHCHHSMVCGTDPCADVGEQGGSRMSKIIKVSTDLKVTVHDFPQGTIRERNRQLCELIGNGCEMIEHVMPRRLYNELGHMTEVKRENSKCVAMLVDEEFLFKDELQFNPIGCYLYETDKHGSPIMGNILFVGDTYTDDGITFFRD